MGWRTSEGIRSGTSLTLLTSSMYMAVISAKSVGEFFTVSVQYDCLCGRQEGTSMKM